MSMNQFQRNEKVIGKKNQELLFKKSVLIIGVGGVGAMLAMSLARMGIGEISLIDDDVIDITNLNRQIHAFVDNVGESKVDVMKKLIIRINPKAKVNTFKIRVSKENLEDLNLNQYDYIADCIDTVSAKIGLIEYAKKNKLNIISSMGAGNRMDPSKIEVSDIYKTSYDPLAKVIRRECRKLKIKDLKVVYSKEEPKVKSSQKENIRKSVPSSVSFLPPTFGLFMASEIIKDFIYEFDK